MPLPVSISGRACSSSCSGSSSSRISCRSTKGGCCCKCCCGCGCGGGCSCCGCCRSTRVNSIHAASIVELLATTDVVPLPTLAGLHLHAVHIGVGRADRVACPEPVGVGGGWPVLPDKGLVHGDVVQSDPGVRAADEGGEVVLLRGIVDGGEYSTKGLTSRDGVSLGGCVCGNVEAGAGAREGEVRFRAGVGASSCSCGSGCCCCCCGSGCGNNYDGIWVSSCWKRHSSVEPVGGDLTCVTSGKDTFGTLPVVWIHCPPPFGSSENSLSK